MFAKCLKSAAIVALLVVLSACDEEQRFDPQGRFHGTEKLRGEEPKLIVAYGAGDLNRGVSISIYSVSVSAKAHVGVVRLLEELVDRPGRTRYDEDTRQWVPEQTIQKSLVVALPAAGIPTAKLLIAGKCASGSASARQIRVCWAKEGFSLEVANDAQSATAEYSLKVVKSGNAPLPARLAAPNEPLTLDELLGRAKFFNYAVAQEAERLFRAKEQVKAAARNLLPSLNTKAIASFFVMGPATGILEGIGSLLPFIFPDKWYKWDQAKALYQAERNSFASMRANEMNGVQTMALMLHRDQAIIKLFDEFIDWEKKIKDTVAQAEQRGVVPVGSVVEFDISLTKMLQDRQQMQTFLKVQKAALAHAVALSPLSDIVGIEGIEYPNLVDAGVRNASEFAAEAEAKSLEVRILDHLIEAARKTKGEVRYSFLNPMSGMDLGFSYPNYLRIADSERRELERQRDEVRSLVYQRASDTAAELNGAVQAYELAELGRRSSKIQLDRLVRAVSLGQENVGNQDTIDRLTETIEANFKFEIDVLNAAYAYLIAQSKLDRLLLDGAYVDLEAGIPAK